MDRLLPLLTLGGAFAVVLLQLRMRWPGWLGLPLALLAIRLALDVGTSAWAHDPTESSGALARGALPGEVNPATLLILTFYGALVVGLLLVRVLRTSAPVPTGARVADVDEATVDRCWRASVAVFSAGAVLNVVSLAFLLRSGSVGDLARRSAYTDLDALSNPLYQGARVLSTAMFVGSLGMVLFGTRSSRRRRTAGLIGATTYIMVQSMLGGRGATISGLITLALVWNYGVQRMRARDGVRFLLVGALAFVYIYAVRFDFTDPSAALGNTVGDVLSADRIDDTAFMLREVPDVLPHSGLGPILAGVSHAYPGVPLPGARNTWSIIVDRYYDGVNPQQGIGGSNFSTAGELYLVGGLRAVVLGGLLVGLAAGVFFEWQRRNRRNPFVLLLASLVVLALFDGASGRLWYALGGLAVGAYVPIAAIAGLSLRPLVLRRLYLLIIHSALTLYLTFLFVRGFAGAQSAIVGLGISVLSTGLKLSVLGLMAAVYISGIRIIQRAGAPFVSEESLRSKVART